MSRFDRKADRFGDANMILDYAERCSFGIHISKHTSSHFAGNVAGKNGKKFLS